MAENNLDNVDLRSKQMVGKSGSKTERVFKYRRPLSGRAHRTAVDQPLLTPNRLLRHQRSISNIAQQQAARHEVQSDTFGHARSMSFRKKAPLTIDVIIVGGGIGGLACAFALGQSGHRVHVLESSSELHRPSGGVRVPPNLSKILKDWGLETELAKMQKCRKSSFYSLKNGDLLGALEWQEDVLRETGGDFYLAHHTDLHRLMYQLASSVGATVSLSSKVSSVAVQVVDGEERPVVTLENGISLVADLVIGADGAMSLVREIVNGFITDEIDTGHSFYTITVPSESLLKDRDLAKWANLPEWPIWMEDSRSALGYPIRNGVEYCLHLYWPDSGLVEQTDAENGWHVVVPTNTVDLEGYDPAIQRLFTMSPTALRTKYISRQQNDDWVDGTGRIVLIGDAAHPFLPCTIHGTSLAVEDAVVLGALMARLSSYDQVPQLTEAFQDLRQDRCCRVIDSELNNAALVTLPAGEQRVARDAAFKASLQARTWDESEMRDQWDEIGGIFGYNAREAADDWWATWGNLTVGIKTDQPHDSPNFKFEVTKVEVQHD